MPEVSNPTAGDVHVNRPLTNFSQKFLQSAAAFVALTAWPNLPVAKQSDLYYVFDRADFYRDEAEERADGAESAGGGFELSTDPYFARVYGFHKDVTDRQRANQDSPVMLDQSATQYVTHKMLIRRERVMATNLFGTNLWFNGVTSASAGQNVDWSDTSSDPIADVRDAIRGVHVLTGYRPNKMLIGREAYDTLVDNDEILARITGGATTAVPAQVMRGLIASLFELDAIYVMDAVYNTAAKGAAASNSFIGGDSALVYYAPNTVGLEEPTAGVQFSWTGLMGNTEAGIRIKRFRMEANEADRIERLRQSEQHAALAIERAFRGVEVLRSAIRERTPAETDGASARLGDRKDQAIPEAVVVTGSVLAGLDQTQRLRVGQLVAGLAEPAQQTVGARRREAEAEAFDEILRHAALFQVAPRGHAFGAA